MTHPDEMRSQLLHAFHTALVAEEKCEAAGYGGAEQEVAHDALANAFDLAKAFGWDTETDPDWSAKTYRGNLIDIIMHGLQSALAQCTTDDR